MKGEKNRKNEVEKRSQGKFLFTGKVKILKLNKPQSVRLTGVLTQSLLTLETGRRQRFTDDHNKGTHRKGVFLPMESNYIYTCRERWGEMERGGIGPYSV